MVVRPTRRISAASSAVNSRASPATTSWNGGGSPMSASPGRSRTARRGRWAGQLVAFADHVSVEECPADNLQSLAQATSGPDPPDALERRALASSTAEVQENLASVQG